MQEAPVSDHQLVEFPGSTIEISVTSSGTIAGNGQASTATPVATSTGTDNSNTDSDEDAGNSTSGSKSKKLSVGAIAGIAIAAAVLLIGLCTLCCVYCAVSDLWKSQQHEHLDNECLHSPKPGVTEEPSRLLHAKSPRSVHVDVSQSETEESSVPKSDMFWSHDNATTQSSGTTHTQSVISDATWLAEEVSVTRKGPEGTYCLHP